MARSLCWIITLLMVFAVIKASREQTNQNGQKIQNRGTARYHSKLTSESNDFIASTIKSPRDKDSRSETVSNSEKYETHFARENSFRSRSKPSKTADGSAVTSRTNARYLNSSVDNSRNRSKLHIPQAFKGEIMNNRHGNDKENVPESQIPKQQMASRRTSSDASSIWIDSAKLDREVLTKPLDYSRSRTGRKIYTNYNGKELKSQIIPTRKSVNENMEKDKSTSTSKLEEKETRLEYSKVENFTSTANISRVKDTKNANDRKEKGMRERDVLPLNSEGILRLDIPPTIQSNENANLLTSATISSVIVSSRQASKLIKEKMENNDIAGSNTKKNKQSDRSTSRAMSNANNSETVNFGSISRRNSSRFADTVNMGTNERSSNTRSRSDAKNVNSRNRSAHKLRNINTTEVRRNKNDNINSETNGQTKTRHNLSNNERMSERKQRSKNDRKLKITETKIDKQNTRAQSGSLSRTVNNPNINTIPKATIIETTVSSLNTEIATFNSVSTTIKPSTIARIFSSTEQTSRNKETNRKEESRMKKPAREDFFNHGLGFRGRQISIEESTTITDLKTTTSKSETQLRGNSGWTLKRRLNYVNHNVPLTTSASVNQTNEIILPNDLSRNTEAPLNNAKVLRRGTKKSKAKDENNILSSIASKNVTRGNKTFNKSEGFGLSKRIEFEESDNYPLGFRTRLKNSNLKLTGEKSTPRISLQTTKSSPASLFSERSKLKLDLARRLIKPELNVDENKFDEMIFVPYSNKSQMKEISTSISEDSNVEKTTKATNKVNSVRVSHENSTIANMQKKKSIIRDRWKILETKKSSKDRNIEGLFRSSTIKNNRIPSGRAIISSSVEGTSMSSITKFNTAPRKMISHRGTISTEETAATTMDTMKIRSSMLQNTTMSREEMSTLANIVEVLDENNIVTTIEPLRLNKTFIEIIKSDKQVRNNDDIQRETAATLNTMSITETLIESMNIHTTEFAHDLTLSPTITTPSSMHSSTMESKKLYPVYIPDTKKHDSSESKDKTKFVSDASKNVFQPRYTKQQEPDKVAISMVTSMTVGPTSRYIRKKSGVFTPYTTIPKPLSTEMTFTQTKHREFRPRTATYRRHSEVPTSQLMIQQPIKVDKGATADSVTITQKPTNYTQVLTGRSRSESSEPLVSVKIDTLNDSMLRFTESNGNSSSSNIFNPTKSAFFSKNSTTLLEQLRSTVAPLLNSLSEKTPIFSGAYSNVNIGNSAPRITPNGSPPRFSARYKGAELFVKKPSIDQVIIPSITTSSTTASTLIENSDLAPPVHINSPGEPRFITFYRALESASIRNENLGVNDVSQRQKLTGGVTKVDSNATVLNGISNDTANNNDTASPISASIATTSFPDITIIDTTTAVQSANISFASRLATEIIPDSTLKITSSMIPENPDMNGQMTTLPITESSGTSISDNTMTNTLANANVSNILMLSNVTEMTEIVTIEASTNVDATSDALPSMTESTFDNVRFIESVDIRADITGVTFSSPIEMMITNVSTPASMNLQVLTNISDTTTSSPITESVTQILPETMTMSVMNDISENIKTNTVQRYDETTPQTTETKDVVENIEMNTIHQFDATILSQMSETMSTTEFITTEEIFNDIITISQDVDIDSKQIMTNRPTDKMSTQNIIDLTTAFSIAYNRSKDQETNARDISSLNMIQNTRNLSKNIEITSLRFADFIRKNDSRSSNDTLLTKLMTIAKTLFSEEINETRQSLFMPDQIYDVETTIVPDTNNLTPANSMIKNNDKNQFVFLNNTSKKINASVELSTVLENFKRVDVTSQNKTEESSNRDPTIGSKISLMELNARPTNIKNSIDVGDITTRIPLFQTKNETSNITMSNNMNSELITNILDSQSSISIQSDNAIETTTIESTQPNQFTTFSNNNIELVDRLSEFITTNNPFVTNSTIAMDMEEMLFDVNESTTLNMSAETVTELTTDVAITQINVARTNVVDASNQTSKPITIESASELQITKNRSLVMNVSDIITTPLTESNDNAINNDSRSSSSMSSTMESIRNLVSSTDTTAINQFNITTSVPQTLTDFVSETPNFITRFQDTTATTIAQGTAVGQRIIQSEQPIETTITSILTTSSEFPAVDTTTILSTSIEPTTDIPTTTLTSTMTTTSTTLQTSSRADLATTRVGSMPETTTPVIDINENLISTDTTTMDTRSTTVVSIESKEPIPSTTIASPIMSITMTKTISPIITDRIISRPPFTSFDVLNTKPYPGFFGGSQATTPVSRFGSSNKAPVRDYQIYGIYPNKTIVRKRPEDNLIDARNINSPYVIFGIFPDGRLVRKFPNGTIIPDSPRNPVEVVFTLSTTTTTNRPASKSYYNQVNQAGTYNQYQSPVYYSRPVDKLTGDVQSPGPIDFGLTGNAIGVPSGVGPKFATSFGPPASAPCANKMNDILLNTRMNTLSNVASMFGKLQTPIGSSIISDRENNEASRTKVASNQRSSVYIGQDKFINYQIDGAPDINPKVVDVKINSVATSMSEGVASSIPSFENLLSNQSGNGAVTIPPGSPWKDPLDQIFGITTSSPIQTASVASNQLNEPVENNVPIMARPINSLVEVFTPIINNVTPMNPENKPTTVSINSIATTTPIITTIPVPITVATPTATTSITTTTTTIDATTTTSTTTTPTTTTTATTAATTTTSTTTIPTTTTTATTAATTTTSITTIPTTTTTATTAATTTTSTTTTPTITDQTSNTSTVPRLTTTASSINDNTLSEITKRSNTVTSLPISTSISTDKILNGLQMNTKENVFGTTFEDLTFLNKLLQNNNVKTTSKTLNDIEQMLANRILALALAKSGPTRSPKAIRTENLNNFNAIKDLPSSESSSEPIIIDLLPSSSTLSPSIGSSASTTKKYNEAKTTTLAQSSTAEPTTTKAPVVITAKPKMTMRPKTTTQASVGFGISLWRALFGSNRFEASTIASAKKNSKPVTSKSVQTTQKSIQITQKPVQIIKSTTHTSHIMSAIKSHTTPKSIDISDIQVISTKPHTDNVDSASASTPSLISTQRTLLNNPNPRLNDVSTSTHSTEDDTKFLVALLRAMQAETKTSTSTTPKMIEDNEAFLRAILNNQASISTTIPSSTELNPAALLALLLKQQGIEPSTPAIKFREQLQLASLDLTTTRSMTTTTNRPVSSSSSQSAVSTKRKTTTPRQSSRSLLRPPGYTWSPSSTYPPPLFGENSGSGLITATRAIGQFLGAAITGAAQQLQSFIRNGTRSIAG